MKTDEFQKVVLESIGGCGWEYFLEDNHIHYSDEFFALIGYAPGEIKIDTDWVANNIHPGDLSQWHDSFVNCLKGSRRYFDCELRFKHKDDHYLWILTRGVVTERDENQRALRIQGIVFDISERKSAKEIVSRYRLFLDNIPIAISLKDQEGRYLYVNRQFESWLGKPSYQINGQTAEQIFKSSRSELQMLRTHEHRVWESGETISMEREFPRTDDGRIRQALIVKFPVFDEAGNILAIGTTNTDVTEQQQAQEAVRLNEIRFRRLFESAPVALYESDWSNGRRLIDSLREQGVEDLRQYLVKHPQLIKRRDDVHTILNANDEAIAMFRSQDKESHIRFIEAELIDEQRNALIEALLALIAGKRRSSYRTVTVRENGEVFEIIRNCELISSDRDDWSLVLVSIQDISVEVEAARQLEAYQGELRSLAGKISLAEESERRRISSELHDGTIQNLVLARIHLARLMDSLEAVDSRELADNINELLESSLKDTRSLIFEISPPVLYELGLEPAVEWLAEHYKQRTGVGITVTSDSGTSELSEELKIVLFQATRELLVNVAKHSQAKTVSVNWRHQDEWVILTVEDDGTGFDVDSARVRQATEGGFGLFALRERLKLLGAEIDIQASDKGTRVTVTAPLYNA